MQQIPLKEYLENNKQHELAKAVKTTPSAVSLWLTSGKEIYVYLRSDGRVGKVVEHRRLPGRKVKVASES